MVNNKIPCALLINDVHVSKDNIPEFHKNWDEALSICQAESITDLIIGGDLWQSRAAQTLNTLLAVREALLEADRRGVDVTIAEGNHCKVDQESIYGYSHVYDQYPGVTVVDDVKCYEYGEISLYIMSYFPENGSFPERLRVIVSELLDTTKMNILYIHEGINGALAVPSDHELPTKIFTHFDKVLVGHYHNRCLIKGTNVEYIGSSRQHNFGEDEEKGYTILYKDGTTKFVKNQVNIRYSVLELDSKEVNDTLLEKIKLMRMNPLYLIKTKIKCNADEALKIDRAKLLEAGISKIDIVAEETLPDEIKSSSLNVKFDKTGIKAEYSSFCKEKEVVNVELGLKYLEKIS